MPVSYEIDANRGLIISRLWDAVTDDEVYEHNRRLRTDPQFNPAYKQLVDLNGITEIKVATRVINDAARDQYFAPGTRRAFAARSDATFGLARMFASHAAGGGQTIEVFRDIDKAREWLGLNPEPSH